jgi:hypothetical protein
LGFHKCRKNGRAVSLNFARLANSKTGCRWSGQD